MANTRSDLMANILAKPPVMNPMTTQKSKMFWERAQILSVAGDGAGHLYPLFRVAAHCRLIQCWVQNTADAGWTDLNLGAYAETDWTLGDGVVIVAADKLIDGMNRAAATTVHLELLGSGTNAYAETLCGAQLWQQLGVATAPRPGTMYDLALQSVGDPAGAGTMTFELIYTLGG